LCDQSANLFLTLRLRKRFDTLLPISYAAAKAREPLTTTEKEGFDLVLVDVQMPETGGLEATTALRETEKKRGGHLPLRGHDRAPYEGSSPMMPGSRKMDADTSKTLHAKELLAVIE
jgi:hypothetical protein